MGKLIAIIAAFLPFFKRSDSLKCSIRKVLENTEGAITGCKEKCVHIDITINNLNEKRQAVVNELSETENLYHQLKTMV